MTRPFWTLLGLISLALGAIGVVLPLLPTTPLVILAAFAFARGSPRLSAMLENHRVFGPIIAEWREKGAIAPRFKAMAVGMMVLTFTGSLIWGLPGHVLLIQAICMGGAALYVLSRPHGTE